MCYSLAAPALWNLLPENIRSAETLTTFKKVIKNISLKKILMLIVCIHMSFTCSFGNDTTNSYLLFFVDYSTTYCNVCPRYTTIFSSTLKLIYLLFFLLAFSFLH